MIGASAPRIPDLRLAPWAAQPDGSPTIDGTDAWPSVVFPVGVEYPEALQDLYVASRTDGALPSGVEVVDELPTEVVVVQPAGPGQRLRVSLQAPWGWTTDTRLIRPPSLRIPPDTPRDKLDALIREAMAPTRGMPAGVGVDVPRLVPCQVAVGTPRNRPSCD